MKFQKVLIISFLLIVCKVFAENEPVIPHVDPSLRFTENKGQWEKFIRFRVQLDGGVLYMEDNALTYDFYDKRKYRDMHMGKVKPKDGTIKGHSLKVQFLGCNVNSLKENYEQGSDYENFYLGKDKSIVTIGGLSPKYSENGLSSFTRVKLQES